MTFKCVGVPPPDSPRGKYIDTQSGKMYWATGNPKSPNPVRFLALQTQPAEEELPAVKRFFTEEFIEKNRLDGETIDAAETRLIARYEVLMNESRMGPLGEEKQAEYNGLTAGRF